MRWLSSKSAPGPLPERPEAPTVPGWHFGVAGREPETGQLASEFASDSLDGQRAPVPVTGSWFQRYRTWLEVAHRSRRHRLDLTRTRIHADTRGCAYGRPANPALAVGGAKRRRESAVHFKLPRTIQTVPSAMTMKATRKMRRPEPNRSKYDRWARRVRVVPALVPTMTCPHGCIQLRTATGTPHVA